MRSQRNANQENSPEINVGNVEIVDIDSIHPWDNNPRTDRGVPFVRKLLRIYGQQSPLQVWRHDMSIRKGNTTWKAMKAEGFTKVAVIFKDFKDVAEADAYALSDNAASDQGEWDNEKRFQLMQQEYLASKKPEELGITDKEFKSIMLSGIKPEKLPDVDIVGDTSGTSLSMIIQFDTQEDFDEFRAIAGITLKHQRVIRYEQFKKCYTPSEPLDECDRIQINTHNAPQTRKMRVPR